jgi:hypothetical protein
LGKKNSSHPAVLRPPKITSVANIPAKSNQICATNLTLFISTLFKSTN